MTTYEEIKQLYDEAINSWTRVDWTTDWGMTQLDLDGCEPDELRGAAEALEQLGGELSAANIPAGTPHPRTAEWDPQQYIEDLLSAADYVEWVMDDASMAGLLATRAVDSVRAGYLGNALANINEACEIESRYGASPTWGPVRDAIRSAAIAEYHEYINAFATAARERDIDEMSDSDE